MNGSFPPDADFIFSTLTTGGFFFAWPKAASVPGLLILGALTDRFPLRAVISLSMFGATLSCVFLWGFAGTNSAVLIVFCVCFGGASAFKAFNTYSGALT